jgi:hypothetical protein
MLVPDIPILQFSANLYRLLAGNYAQREQLIMIEGEQAIMHETDHPIMLQIDHPCKRR